MRPNRIYRARYNGGTAHLARADATARLPLRAICGTRLRAAVEATELRGDFGRDGDCGRCDRVLSTRGNIR